ncbi:MAG: aminotransferase class V-fold PLP-dependent enzyme [Halothece sp.]
MSETAWETYWALNPQVTYLNHGSFGACPKPVLHQQQQLRAEMESEPTQFFRHLEPRLDQAREALAAFIGAKSSQLAFVANATTAVNTVLRSLVFDPGDEILITDHGYNACSNAVKFVADRYQAKVVVAEISFPVTSPQAVIDAILAKVSSRTRLALIDHVTSPTALIFPIAAIVQVLEEKGIPVLVDGAHAPGMLPLNLEEIGASYYTGNCHKWLCAPKGSAFLYVRDEDQQAQIRPLVISHGANREDATRSQFHLEFDWMGTADPTPYLCIPEAIQFWSQVLGGGWEQAQQRNHELIVQAREYLIQQLGWLSPCPTDMMGSMSSLLLPKAEFSHLSSQQLHSKLFETFHIEVPVIKWFSPPQRLIRISAQLYNQFSDYQALATALDKIRSKNII